MKSVIIGTAGHIDHGKTALVKALTGIDADRLEEEKRRGITIDIGFAHLDLSAPGGETLRLGFVDVPGHERFVRNMLAGIGGIDLVLLVIAADESIKPQTREHFDICRLLSVRGGITVLTKSDAVDAETIDVVRLEVEDFLSGSFLDSSHSPIIAVSSLTGAGLNDLKRALAQVATEVAAKDPSALARLPIDRVFTMKGFGTVVTGTLVAGAIHKEEELELFPTGRRVRVRGVQVHGSAADKAVAGQRTALNLAGVATEDLSRGMMLAPPDTFHTTTRVDVSLSLLKSGKPLKDRARVHFHSYTMETVAEVVLYEGTQAASSNPAPAPKTPPRLQLRPGETAFAQLRLPEPALLLPGDRFIIRQFSPVITIGGGVVLDPSPIARVPNADAVAFLRQLQTGSLKERLLARVARRGLIGYRLQDAPTELNLPLHGIIPHDNVMGLGSELASEGLLINCGNSVAVSPEAFALAHSEVLKAIKRFHDLNPLVPGINKEQLYDQLNIGPEVFEAVTVELQRKGNVELSGDLVRLPGRGVVMKDEEAESKKTIEQAFSSAGLRVPFLRDVLAGLKVDKSRAQKIVTLLLRDKILVKISEELVFHRTALEELRSQMKAYKAKSPKIDVGKFKDMTGVSRKYAIPLLEYLDRERVTRRVGDEREIL
jgi:selenocysteine-specific elongation factor